MSDNFHILFQINSQWRKSHVIRKLQGYNYLKFKFTVFIDIHLYVLSMIVPYCSSLHIIIQINFIQKLARAWAYARALADKGHPGKFVISVK